MRRKLKRMFSGTKAAVLVAFAVMIITFGTLAFYYAEPVLPSGQRNTLFLSLYWVAETITTVGYGDIYPNNTVSRIVFFFVIILGVGTYALIATEVSAFVIERKFLESRGLHRTNMREHVIIVGYNDASWELIRQLREQNVEYVVVDEKIDVSSLKVQNITAISGNPLSAEALKRAGIEKAETLIISDQPDELAIMASLKARKLNPSLKIIASCSRFEDFDIMKQAKIDVVIPLSRMHGGILANAVLDSNGADFLMNIVTEEAGLGLGEIPVRGATVFSELNIGGSERPIAIIREGRAIIAFEGNTPLSPGDVVITLHASARPQHEPDERTR